MAANVVLKFNEVDVLRIIAEAEITETLTRTVAKARGLCQSCFNHGAAGLAGKGFVRPAPSATDPDRFLLTEAGRSLVGELGSVPCLGKRR